MSQAAQMLEEIDLPIQLTAYLPGGRLDVLGQSDQPWSLLELLGVGARRNPKRGFLLVSKVLGKHIPTRPKLARRAWKDLAKQIGDLGLLRHERAHFIGLAETATALGQGVWDEWCKLNPNASSSYQHTTRYHLGKAPLLSFEEPHSHATSHLIQRMPGAEKAKVLVLIDDELSTGTTLQNLASAWAQLHPGSLERVVLVSLADFCPRHQEIARALREQGIKEVQTASLFEGHLNWKRSPAWQPELPPPSNGNGKDKSALLNQRGARIGILQSQRQPLRHSLEQKPDQGKVLVIGLGEDHFPAWQLAEELEESGCEAWVSGTTRSPVMEHGAIRSAMHFPDSVDDGIENHLYNFERKPWSHIYVCCQGRCEAPSELMYQLGPKARMVRFD